MPEIEPPAPEPELPMTRPRRASAWRDLGVVLLVVGAAGIVIAFLAMRNRHGSGTSREITQMRQLELATVMYIRSYKALPFALEHGHDADLLIADAPSYDRLLAALTGTDPALNPRGQRFLELAPGDTHRDAWGHSYIIGLDMDRDGSITHPDIGTITATIAIWSPGPDGEWEAPVTDNTLPKNRDNIVSWATPR